MADGSAVVVIMTDPALALWQEAEAKVYDRWRERIVFRLSNLIDKEIRGTLPPAMQTEQQALAVIRQIAQELDTAGKALDTAAARLLSKGDGKGANDAKTAALRARSAVQAITEGTPCLVPR